MSILPNLINFDSSASHKLGEIITELDTKKGHGTSDFVRSFRDSYINFEHELKLSRHQIGGWASAFMEVLLVLRNGSFSQQSISNATRYFRIVEQRFARILEYRRMSDQALSVLLHVDKKLKKAGVDRKPSMALYATLEAISKIKEANASDYDLEQLRGWISELERVRVELSHRTDFQNKAQGAVLFLKSLRERISLVAKTPESYVA